MLPPNTLIRVWGPPSALVDYVTGDVSVSVGGVVIATVPAAYTTRQELADRASEVAPTQAEHTVVQTATGTETLVAPPDHSPRQLVEAPSVPGLGPAPNLPVDAEPGVQMPPEPSDTKGVRADDETLTQKKTLIGKLLGTSDAPPKRDSKAPKAGDR